MNPYNDEETAIVQVFNDIAEATSAKNKLEEVGITTMIVDENAIGLNPLGGFRLKIFQKDLEKAKQVLGIPLSD